jgi:hypothetical protein
MANQEQVQILKKGASQWNQYREQKEREWQMLFRMEHVPGPPVVVDFSGADLEGLSISAADLSHALLHNANLKKVVAFDVNLRGANLERANFSSANLTGANLSRANLENALLQKADLTHTVLDGTKLIHTDFSHCVCSSTIFAGLNMSTVKGLDTIKHHGRSYLDLHTVYLSEGSIPEVFLRGCGFSDIQIEMMKLSWPGLEPEQVTDITYKIHHLYLNNGIQYYSCFISYNNNDEEFAYQLHGDLQNNGVRCWFAPEDMKIGDPIRPTIDQQIRRREKLLVILSENSVKSEWVGDEVEAALEEESQSNRLVLFPIRLDNAVMNTRDDWAAKIKRRRHIGDFSNWKDKTGYQKAFERLLSDLKATGE